MKIGFQETEESVRFFFDKKVDLNNCVVCMEDGKIVSSLHIIPTKIRWEKDSIPVDYIYAATTLPEFRSKGYMSKLICEANKISLLRGNKASILIPATKSLFSFYKKLGYKNFYKYKKVIISNSQMKQFVKKANIFDKTFCLEDVFGVYIKNHVGFGDTVWDKTTVEYAFNINEFLGGVNVFSDNRYAMCYIQKQNTVKIAEFSTSPSDVNNLLGNIYYKLPNYSSYELILPVNYTQINLPGDIFNHGLIKPYTPELDPFVQKVRNDNNCPYFSFTLE